MVEVINYAAIRKSRTEGYEFFLPDDIGIIPEEAERKAKEKIRETPEFAKQNPVVRIAKVKITEIEED